MKNINKSLFNSLFLNYGNETFNVLSYEGKFFDDLISQLYSQRNNFGEYNFKFYMALVDNKIILNKVISNDSRNKDKILFGVQASTTNDVVTFDNINYCISDFTIVLVNNYIENIFSTAPYYYAYEFRKIIYCTQHNLTELSALTNELRQLKFKIYLNMKNPNIAKLKYDEIVSKYNLAFNYEDVLAFEDFYELKVRQEIGGNQ